MARRNTVQREAIKQAFLDNDRPLSVEDVLAASRRHVENINQATVYRNLKLLIDEGWLIQVEYPELGTLYERSDKPHHHHFFCQGCRRLLELPGCAVDENVGVPDNFVVTGHELFIIGKCDKCASKSGKGGGPQAEKKACHCRAKK